MPWAARGPLDRRAGAGAVGRLGRPGLERGHAWEGGRVAGPGATRCPRCRSPRASRRPASQRQALGDEDLTLTPGFCPGVTTSPQVPAITQALR